MRENATVTAPDPPEPPRPKGRRTPARPRSSIGRSRDRDAFLLVLPALIPILVLSVWPLAQGIYLAFTNTVAGQRTLAGFVGGQNFQRLLDYPQFWQSFQIGMVWAVSVTVLQFVLAFGLALLLNSNLRGGAFARVLALVPWAMPPVIVAIMWQLMYDPRSGPINGFLLSLGVIDHPINWLGDFSTALPAVILVGVWVGMPATTVVLLAGLQAIDPSLHEAAAVDGGGAWQRFWHITLPGLRPVIAGVTTLDFIWAFNSFPLVYVLTAGGPGGKTMLPMLFAYNEAFKYGNFGLASAMGVVLVVLVVTLMLVYLRAQKQAER